MRIIICLLLIIAFVGGAVSEAILQVNYQTNAGIHVMTKLLSQSDLGIAQVVGGVAGIVNIGEKIIRSMRVH